MEDTVRDGTRTVNGFPLTGRFSVAEWAETFFKCSEKTVWRHIHQHNVPFKRCPGDVCYVEANAFWDAIPDSRAAEAPPPKRGGSRRKKG